MASRLPSQSDAEALGLTRPAILRTSASAPLTVGRASIEAHAGARGIRTDGGGRSRDGRFATAIGLPKTV